MKIIATDADSMTLGAFVNLTNPTEYSTDVPYADINILVNDTIIGHATVRDMYVHPGNITDVGVSVKWEPSKVNGTAGGVVGRELLSQYLSGRPRIFFVLGVRLTYTRVQCYDDDAPTQRDDTCPACIRSSTFGSPNRDSFPTPWWRRWQRWPWPNRGHDDASPLLHRQLYTQLSVQRDDDEHHASERHRLLPW